MLKSVRRTTALLVLTLLATTMATAQTVNMSKYITLTVQQGQQIRLDLKAAAAGTGVKIVSGFNEQTITVGTSWTDFQNYTAGAGTMTIYGNITGFNCSSNGTKLTALVSHNTALIELICENNQLTALDVSQNTALKSLWCQNNQITALNVSQDTALTALYCERNRLTSLDVSQNTALIELICYNNRLTSLDVTQNTALKILDCSSNPLTSLDVSHNTALTGLDCSSNQLTSLDVSQNTALKELYCRSNQLTALDVSQNTALTGLDCSGNQLTSLNVSQNTAMKTLWCNGNSFTTQAFNDLMCSLPARTTADNARFYPLWNASDAGASAFMATNSQIATAKNWQVRYWAGNEDEIPATTGTYTCPVVNMSRYITLTVTQGQQIRLNLRAAAAGTKVKVVSGSTDTEVTVGTDWTGSQSYTAGATTMTVYGDIAGFDCNSNGAKLTALDVSHNTALKELNCGDNQLTSLNVSHNTALIELICYNNRLTSLDVTQNTALTGLGCSGNRLTSLNVSHNTALTGLDCSDNQLTSLNVSQNTALKGLFCGSNQLTSLDVSHNTALKELVCSGNSFTTQAFNDLMCSLPARTTADNAKFYLLNNASDAGASAFMAANSQIAKDKNWQVRYWEGNEDEIPATTGTYVCGTGIAEIASVPLTVYPNPATDILTVETEATGSVITLTDLSGRVVMIATATGGKTTLNIAHLSAGTYIVRVGNRVGKVVKR